MNRAFLIVVAGLTLFVAIMATREAASTVKSGIPMEFPFPHAQVPEPGVVDGVAPDAGLYDIASPFERNPTITIGPHGSSITLTFDPNGMHTNEDGNVDVAAKVFFGVIVKGQVDAYMDSHIRDLCSSGRVCKIMGHQWSYDLDIHLTVCGICGQISPDEYRENP